MKKKFNSKSPFFKLRISTVVVLCLVGIAAVLLAVIAIDPVAGKGDFVIGGASPTPTPTATPVACSWLAGRDLPSVGVRSAGVFFPSNFHHSRDSIGGGFTALPGQTATPPPLGKFFAMGGRSSDTAGSDFAHPFQYDPASNIWTTTSATYPDNQVSDMACGVLNVNGVDYIYCVGGSAAGATTATDRVFRYDPVTDTITTIAAPWPGAMGTILPGGFSVFNNKLYILGGFNINAGVVDTIWEFTPCPAGWVQKSAHLTTALGYIPTATLGNIITTAGGSTWDGTALHDSTVSFAYDPVADTIGHIAAIPRATSQTRGLTFCGSMYVMGGGSDAPNPSNEVDIYDPSTNSWSTGQPFVTARRNFATDTDTTSRIWLAGGYDTSGSPIDSMEIFNCSQSPCAPPTPSPTPKQIVNRTSLGRTPVTPSCMITINEGFDDITNLPGWVLINHSQPLGGSDWFQGNEGVFPAFDGLPDAYIAANYYNGGGLATISDWLLTPEVTLQDGSTLTFYTRTVQASGSLAALGMPSGACGTNVFPDRLQVRMSTNGASTNVGATATDVGDFTNLLLDINPTYAIGGYPETWTQFTITVSGVPSGTSGRLALRYFVEDGGPEGTRSNYVGIDRAVYCAVPPPRVTPTPRPRPTPAVRPTPPPRITPVPPPPSPRPTPRPRP